MIPKLKLSAFSWKLFVGRLKVKEDLISELHDNLLSKDEEIVSLKSCLDEQKNKNNVR